MLFPSSLDLSLSALLASASKHCDTASELLTHSATLRPMKGHNKSASMSSGASGTGCSAAASAMTTSTISTAGTGSSATGTPVAGASALASSASHTPLQLEDISSRPRCLLFCRLLFLFFCLCMMFCGFCFRLTVWFQLTFRSCRHFVLWSFISKSFRFRWLLT